MTNLRIVGSLSLVLLIALISLSGVPSAAASRVQQETAEQPVPDNFDQFLVYMAEGTYDPEDPDYEAPDGMFFHTEIMERSEAEIEEDRANALAFFAERFGIDPATTAGVEFMSFMVDPRNEYRAYVVSGESVPSEGWMVRDGGWRLAVTAEEGVELGGEFAGTTAPQGAFMVFGDYNIDVPDEEPIIIHYESGSPIIPNEDGSLMFICDLAHPDFGQGLAQGISAPMMLSDGRRQANIRNVLTFPGLGQRAAEAMMTATGSMTETTSMTETMGMTETSGVTDAHAAVNIVQVSLVEWAIEMPEELPAGPTTFVVTNDGTANHNFEIENEETGFEEVFAENLQTGETMTMTVDLQPGEYYVYCPIGNHAERGMELTLTVTEEEAAAPPDEEDAAAEEAAMPAEDMAMAEDLWQQMQEANYQEEWATVPGKGAFYQGQPPHGALLSTYFNPEAADAMEAQPGEMPADAIIVKENYDADRNLLSLTVMYKEPGYDPEHMDWYWASYGPNGEVQMAGQAPGCIACHGAVRSNDYIFTVPIAPIEP